MLNLDQFLQFTIKWPAISYNEVVSLALLMFFIILSLLEAHFPKIQSSRNSRNQSYRTNIGLLLFNSAAMPIASAASLWLLADYYAGKGLLNYVSNPIGQAILAFLTLDLMLYLWHRASHQFDCLWMFHRVHHSDTQMNVSTAFRVHILELLIMNALKAVYIIGLGVDKIVLITGEAVMTTLIMFHHSNFSFPGENLMKHVIIVPRLHRVHHSLQRAEHDRNYGAVLSIWDRLLGTWAELEPLAIGIHNNPGQDVMSQLKLGFTPVIPPATPSFTPGVRIDLQSMVAEAAYYKAQHRGFLPGHDLADWLEAEKEILTTIRDAAPQSKKPKGSTVFGCCLPALSC